MITYFLCGAVAVLIITLIELVQSRKRIEACLAIKEAQMNRLFDELNAAENEAREMLNKYCRGCI